MDEFVRRQYLTDEEEFLQEFYETVDVVLPRLGHAWQPNYRCNDGGRWRRDQLLARANSRS